MTHAETRWLTKTAGLNQTEAADTVVPIISLKTFRNLVGPLLLVPVLDRGTLSSTPHGVNNPIKVCLTHVWFETGDADVAECLRSWWWMLSCGSRCLDSYHRSEVGDDWERSHHPSSGSLTGRSVLRWQMYVNTHLHLALLIIVPGLMPCWIWQHAFYRKAFVQDAWDGIGASVCPCPHVSTCTYAKQHFYVITELLNTFHYVSDTNLSH